MNQWNTGYDPAQIVSNEHLHLLGSAGDVIEHVMAGSVQSPASDDLTQLAVQCQDWLRILTQESDFPDQLRLSLVAHLEHVIWLIENAKKFGVARVAVAGHRAVGELILAQPAVPEKSKQKWREMVEKTCVVLAGLTMLFTAGTAVLESGGAFVTEVRSITTGASGYSPDSDSNVVDAEIVEGDDSGNPME